MSRKKKTRPVRPLAEREEKDARVHRDADGHVHLQLHEDPASGQQRLALTRPIFAEDWQNQFATATANTAWGTLRDQPSAEGAVELARHAMTSASALADQFLAQLPDGAVACRAGCDHCCHQVVSVTPPEALAIVEHLRASLSPEDLASIVARVAEAHARGRGLSSADRFSPEHPCPFLEEGRCSIYEVRPLACRGMNSRDASACESNLREPAARAAFLANARGGTSFAEPIRAFLAISAGLQIGLSEIYNLDMRPLDLTAAVLLLLRDPQSSAARWLAGETPFADARAPDDANEARMRELAGMLPAG